MQKQISIIDIIRIFVAFVIWFILFSGLAIWAVNITIITGIESIDIILIIMLEGFGISFLAMFLALIIVSNRYKLIAGVLLIIAEISFRLYFDMSFAEFYTFIGSVIRLSLGMTGTMSAIFLWERLIGDKRKILNFKSIADKTPRPSLVLIVLSLISIPLTYMILFVSSFVVLGISAFILYILFQFPRIPLVLILAAFVAPLVGLWASIKSILAVLFPATDFQPAIRIDMTKSKQLNELITDVCKMIGVKTPDIVLLHAEPTFYVMQGKADTFSGIVKGRILAIGAPFIRYMSSSEIRSILAHEFAHFSGRDTMYSTFVSPVYRSISSSISTMQGASSQLNALSLFLFPSFGFLTLFISYFAKIDMILSRTRELRADWIAARTYGKVIFSKALNNVVAISSFEREFNEKLLYDLNEGNYFLKLNKEMMKNNSKMQSYKESAREEITSHYDSHPTLQERVDLISNIHDKGKDENVCDIDILTELLSAEEVLSKKYIDHIKLLKKLYEEYMEQLREQQEESHDNS